MVEVEDDAEHGPVAVITPAAIAAADGDTALGERSVMRFRLSDGALTLQGTHAMAVPERPQPAPRLRLLPTVVIESAVYVRCS